MGEFCLHVTPQKAFLNSILGGKLILDTNFEGKFIVLLISQFPLQRTLIFMKTEASSSILSENRGAKRSK